MNLNGMDLEQLQALRKRVDKAIMLTTKLKDTYEIIEKLKIPHQIITIRFAPLGHVIKEFQPVDQQLASDNVLRMAVSQQNKLYSELEEL